MRIGRIWHENNVNSMAAALAFYVFFALPAIAVLMLTVIRWMQHMLSAVTLDTPFFTVLDTVASQMAVPQVSTLPLMLNVFGVVIIFFSATRAFTHIERSFNCLWTIRDTGLKERAKKKVYFFGMLILLGILLVAGLFLNTVATALVPILGFVAPVVSFVVILFLLTLFIAFLYTLAPDTRVSLTETLPGAVFSAVSILLIYQLFSVYTGFGLNSLYSAVGSVFLLLLWIYYSSLTFFLGAILVRLRTLKDEEIEKGAC